MAVEIRTATPAEVDAVRFVGFSTWPATYGPICGPSFVLAGLDEWWSPQALAYSLGHGLILVAQQEDAVVGVAEYGVTDAGVVLWKLYVLPSHHGRGVGSALLARVADVAAQRSCALITECHASNGAAVAFYTARGFRRTGLNDNVFGKTISWQLP